MTSVSFLEQAAREMAKEYLHRHRRAGWNYEQWRSGPGGSWGGGNRLNYGSGTAWSYIEGVDNRKTTTNQIAVTQAGGVDCMYVFNMKQLWEEIEHPENLVAQMAMFQSTRGRASASGFTSLDRVA